MSRNPFTRALEQLHPENPKPLHLKRASDMHDMQLLLEQSFVEFEHRYGLREALIAQASANCFGDDALALAQEWCVHDE